MWACEEDCAGFAIFSPRYKRGGFFRVPLLLWTAIQVSSRDNSRSSIYVLYSNLNRKLWARVFCTHICVCVYAFIHICLFVICLRIHTYTTHTYKHTQRILAMLSVTFFPVQSRPFISWSVHIRETFMCALIELSVSTICDEKNQKELWTLDALHEWNGWPVYYRWMQEECIYTSKLSPFLWFSCFWCVNKIWNKI